MYGYHGDQAITKVPGLASNSITIFGKTRQLAPASIMQNEEFFSVLKEKANLYLDKVLKAPTKENKQETYLHKMVEQVYQIIKKSNPSNDEIIHLVTSERDLADPEATKNRLTAEFSSLLLAELRKKNSSTK